MTATLHQLRRWKFAGHGGTYARCGTRSRYPLLTEKEADVTCQSCLNLLGEDALVALRGDGRGQPSLRLVGTGDATMLLKNQAYMRALGSLRDAHPREFVRALEREMVELLSSRDLERIGGGP